MRRSISVVLAVLGLAMLNGNAHAQLWDRLTNPSVKVPITHPPEVELASASRLAVHEFTGSGRCAQDLSFKLSQTLQQTRQFEVIDPRSGDPAAFFTGRIAQCSTDVYDKEKAGETKERNGNVKTRYVRRAIGHLTAQVTLVDAATGHIEAADLIEVTDSLMTEATDAEPAPPSTDALRARLFAGAISQIERIVLPWDETVSLVVYDDDKCGLKASAAQIKHGKFDDAVVVLQASLAKECDAPKDNNILSKVSYNLGIALTYAEHPEDALIALRASAALRKSEITDHAIGAANKIIELNNARRRAIDEAMAAQAPPPGTPTLLANKDIIELSAAKLSDAIIIAKIRSSPCRFDVSTDGLVALKRAGVSDPVVVEMTDAAGSRCK